MGKKDMICPSCNTERFARLYSTIGTNNHTYSLARCESCKLVTIIPFPNFNEIQNEYKKVYYKKDSFKFKEVLENGLPFLKFKRRGYIESLKNGSTILDIGCGAGRFLKSMDKGRWTCFGIELSEDAAALALKDSELNIKIGGLTEESYPKKFFDVVTLWHVFEHLLEPNQQLKIIGDILKDNGLIVIAVPNIESLEALLFKRYWYHLDIPRHVYHYSSYSLKSILEKNGFRIISINQFVPKNILGLMMSVMNYIGFDFNLFKEVYLGNASLKSPRVFIQLFLIFILSPIIIFISIFILAVETITKKAGTIEVYAIKGE